eukprot:m.257906 g.257906  ORF g.257906 m.257906 type:complete len:300 (+) comp26609_c0_seq2:716-1615(+)
MGGGATGRLAAEEDVRIAVKDIPRGRLITLVTVSNLTDGAVAVVEHDHIVDDSVVDRRLWGHAIRWGHAAADTRPVLLNDADAILVARPNVHSVVPHDDGFRVLNLDLPGPQPHLEPKAVSRGPVPGNLRVIRDLVGDSGAGIVEQNVVQVLHVDAGHVCPEPVAEVVVHKAVLDHKLVWVVHPFRAAGLPPAGKPGLIVVGDFDTVDNAVIAAEPALAVVVHRAVEDARSVGVVDAVIVAEANFDVRNFPATVDLCGSLIRGVAAGHHCGGLGVPRHLLNHHVHEADVISADFNRILG